MVFVVIYSSPNYLHILTQIRCPLAKTIITETLTTSNVPESGVIPQSIAQEVVLVHGWLEKTKLGQVITVSVVCAHCGRTADKLVMKNSRIKKGQPDYCSFACRESKINKLPKGMICRVPNKEWHTTLEEAETVAAKVSAQLLTIGDSEGVVAYSCTCGRWHTGHVSKHEWLVAAQNTITVIAANIASLM